MTEALDDVRQAAATEPSVTEPETKPVADKTPPAPGTETDEPEAAPVEKPKVLDARDKAIRALAVEQRELRRQLAAERERADRAAPAKDPNAPLSQADFDKLVDERAEAKVAERERTAKTEAWIAVGNAEYSEPVFMAKCNEIADMGGNTPAFIAAIGRVPAGHKVVAHLAEEPAEAVRILKLPPVEMAIEISAIAHRLAAEVTAAEAVEPEPKPVTRMAAPIKPISTSARAEPRPETMSEAQYQKYWNERTRGKNRVT